MIHFLASRKKIPLSTTAYSWFKQGLSLQETPQLYPVIYSQVPFYVSMSDPVDAEIHGHFPSCEPSLDI